MGERGGRGGGRRELGTVQYLQYSYYGGLKKKNLHEFNFKTQFFKAPGTNFKIYSLFLKILPFTVCL